MNHFEPTQDQIEMWRRGCSCRQIAQGAEVSRATLCRAMRRMGLDLIHRPRPLVDEIIKECQKLRAEGVVMRDIVDIVGYSERQIQRWLNPKVVEAA